MASPGKIQIGANIPMNTRQGTTPNMGGGLDSWFQVLTFTQVTKTVQGFELIETVATTQFWGVYMPASARELQILDIGERAWTYFKLYSQSVLTLQVDDVVVFPQINNKQTRVMSREDYSQYGGFCVYVLCQDFTSAGPPTPP